MTRYTCYECTGRGDELVTFTVDGLEPSHCPGCGQTHTVETANEYFERHDNGRYMDAE